MLFNSPLFLLAFLPAALVLHELAERFVPRWRLPLIVLLSFLFYASWDVRFVPLLAASILLNWLAAEAFGTVMRGEGTIDPMQPPLLP